MKTISVDFSTLSSQYNFYLANYILILGSMRAVHLFFNKILIHFFADTKWLKLRNVSNFKQNKIFIAIVNM